MQFRFTDPNLERLYTDPDFDLGFPQQIVRAFRKRVQAISSAVDERDLRAVKGNHFEKLKGRDEEYSVRLNRQWRLTMTFEKQEDGKVVVLLRIEDYH